MACLMWGRELLLYLVHRLVLFPVVAQVVSRSRDLGNSGDYGEVILLTECTCEFRKQQHKVNHILPCNS